MEERISIVTPDHVELEFEPAGIGSRLLALIYDTVLMFAAILILIAIGAIIFGAIPGAPAGQLGGSFGLAILVIFIFLLMWGYFVFFEALNRGQTPGKKSAGIRVVRDDGLPVGWREAALRNFVRAADILPPPACVVGGLTILFSKRNKRLGDLLAGTMVVREDFDLKARGRASQWEAGWVAGGEKGRQRRGVMLADMKIEAKQIQVIESFRQRRESLPVLQRQSLAWRIASPFLGAMGEDTETLAHRADRFQVCERILDEIVRRANTELEEESADDKRREWREFAKELDDLHKQGKTGLRRLRPDQLTRLLERYRRLACDLARARSLSRDSLLVQNLNDLAIRAHNIFYGHIHTARPRSEVFWAFRFPKAVREHLAAVGLAALLLFGSAAISFVAIQLHPEFGYDLVPDGFLDFEPARPDSLHNIPPLARPITASSLVSNNIQVTLLAFGFGMTAGLGTCFILVFNGVQIGAIAGWMTSKGNGRALWGWIMPHGGTELLAITLAGAAGFMLARALIAPGQVRRTTALKNVAMSALTIELGVMIMLVVAGAIEAFVSPSSIGFTARIAVLAVTLVLWLGYFSLAGLKNPRR